MAASYDDSVSWMTMVSILMPLSGLLETWPLDDAAGTNVHETSGGHSVAADAATPVRESVLNCPVARRTFRSALIDTRWPSRVVRAAPVLMVA